MANPATELADQLEAWTVPAGVDPQSLRGDGEARSDDFWRQHRRAVENMVAVEGMADALARQHKDVYIREIFPDLYRAIFAVSTPWGSVDSGNVRPTVDRGTIRALRVFATLIDEYDVEVDVNGIPAIRDSLVGVERLLLDASQRDMPRNTRIYLLELIADALEALDDPLHDGGRRVRTATHAVAGALTAELTRVPDVPGPAGGPAGAKSFRRRLADAVKMVIVTSVLAFAESFGSQAGDAAWELTESAVSQAFEDLSEAAARPDDTAPELEPAPERRQLPPGSSDSGS